MESGREIQTARAGNDGVVAGRVDPKSYGARDLELSRRQIVERRAARIPRSVEPAIVQAADRRWVFTAHGGGAQSLQCPGADRWRRAAAWSRLDFELRDSVARLRPR